MTGVEPISRGATSQHFTIKLQPHISTQKTTHINNFLDGGWIRTNEFSNYEPDEITTSPLHRIDPPGLEPRTFGFENHCSIH